MKQRIIDEVIESSEVKKKIAEDNKLLEQIENCSKLCIDSLKEGGKTIFCGNGGSFSDSQLSEQVDI